MDHLGLKEVLQDHCRIFTAAGQEMKVLKKV